MNLWNVLYILYVFVLCDIFRIWGNSDGQLYSIRNSLLILNLNNFDPATLLSFHVTGECLLPT